MDKADYKGFLYAASKDVLVIEALSDIDASMHSEAITFHAQQAAEKMIKAVYTANGEIPPKSHDLGDLLGKAIEKGWLTCEEESIQSAINLSMFAVAARYESIPEISEGEAFRSIADCNAVSAMLADNGYESIPIRSDAHYLRDEAEEANTTEIIEDDGAFVSSE